VSLKTKILVFFLMIGLSVKGQSFLYSYVDPCTKETKFITADISSPIVIAYYGQVRSFSYQELQDGTFDLWMNDTYNKYKNTSPCQGAVATTTTTTNTNLTSNLVNSVLNLNSITSIGSIGSVGVNIGSTTNTGSGSVGSSDNKQQDENTESSQNTDGGSNSDNTGSGSGSGSSNSSGGNGRGSGKGSSEGQGETQEQTPEEKSPEEIETQKTETQKEASSNTAKSASKAKTQVQKPAILVTGDIVGIQSAGDGSQDVRGTGSFTRVKGDGTASISFSGDYMVNAKIGNLTATRSWMGVNPKGHKHINVASVSGSVFAQSWSSTVLFVRVNSVKNFTGLYGGAGTYGILYGEPMISTLAIGGFMYKGKLTKALDGTLIMAAVWSPYTKYYTESFLESKPIVVPFLNLNYKLTKTFGVGLTGGGTYVAGQNILNYQILCGAKLIL
jgi:hypothetical protein